MWSDPGTGVGLHDGSKDDKVADDSRFNDSNATACDVAICIKSYSMTSCLLVSWTHAFHNAQRSCHGSWPHPTSSILANIDSMRRLVVWFHVHIFLLSIIFPWFPLSSSLKCLYIWHVCALRSLFGWDKFPVAEATPSASGRNQRTPASRSVRGQRREVPSQIGGAVLFSGHERHVARHGTVRQPRGCHIWLRMWFSDVCKVFCGVLLTKCKYPTSVLCVTGEHAFYNA